MANSSIAGFHGISGGLQTEPSEKSTSKPIDENIQKFIDKLLHANGRPSAQKFRNDEVGDVVTSTLL